MIALLFVFTKQVNKVKTLNFIYFLYIQIKLKLRNVYCIFEKFLIVNPKFIGFFKCISKLLPLILV